MATTVVVKLLGRNIGYNTFQNKNFNLWKPPKPFQLMDVEHGYYLPWTLDFNPLQPYPSVVVTWIRLSSLPGFLYKRKIFEEIDNLVGGPLIPQVLVNGKAQLMEYEALPSICFGCGRYYGHTKNLCPYIFGNSNSTREKGETTDPAIGENMSTKVAKAFGSWMVLERKIRQNFRENQNQNARNQEDFFGSRFEILNPLEDGDDAINGDLADLQGITF
ncbi:hypothetical protein Godav_021902 [Gossypium davidsonii]|uniref:DUF4283 domain-containing protein n=1 Tax=Gossypium davidsonii TaxID=34287 RepID=A0A7J8TDH5_GOSDV|nr:hypothetical protein [Gossypium davidsonii]